jgi:hypothetical protein
MPRRGSGFPPNVNRKSAGVPKGVVTILELDNGRIYTSLYMQICKRTWYFSPGELDTKTFDLPDPSHANRS